MSTERVMLLIDADNVSVDVMEQAIALLLTDHGALHVRRAYCTAESAVKHQDVFKRLLIKPMVNLSAGKNSTDIALAVDALDLVLAERPDVVVIASSDSDFAPLVSRLREKGCRVRGVGQLGKTSSETPGIYDSFDEFAHYAAPAKVRATRAPAKRLTTKTELAPTATASTTAKKPLAKKSIAKTSVRKAAKAAVQKPEKNPAPVPVPTPVSPPVPIPALVADIFRVLPQLAHTAIELSKASEALRKEHVLSKRSTSRKLFEQHAEWFELNPADRPTQVRARKAPQG